MTKGNEKDCICANNGKHTKNCDAYRLSQFSLQMAVVALDEPDSLEEKKCCKKCLGVYGRDFSPCNNSSCTCHQPETTKTCTCAEFSCKEDCARIHTHKGFFCESCKPENIHERSYEAGRLAMKEEVVSLIEDYFRGLLLIPFPELTKVKLLAAIREMK